MALDRPANPSPESGPDLRELLATESPAFASAMEAETWYVTDFARALAIRTMRLKAIRSGLLSPPTTSLRLAIAGGCNLKPLADLIEHFVSVICDVKVDLWLGDYDNYISEILEPGSELHEFRPEVLLLIPSEQRCRYTGKPSDPISEQETAANQAVQDLLDLCRQVHEGTGTEVILGNFRLPPTYDPGPLRHTGLASDYAFRKWVNMRLGLGAPSYVHICDIEFLANRLGTARAVDPRTWFESKQPFSAELMVPVAREVAHCVKALKQPPKKVLVLDLDNTLWGGVVGDDGLEGIEIGTTSPRGEAFRHFQESILKLADRGVLLAVCSKNDHEKAVEPFLKHPEMVLKLADIVNFKANWDPKSDNIRRIATELNLGLDSFVFVDDNPAEIDIVRQFVPEVTCILLGDDPSYYASTLLDARLFETRGLTAEDSERAALYRQEAKRQELQSTSTDMGAYLASLNMVAEISEFIPVDVPRITQLIGRSNQFNVTTIRRTEAEVTEVMRSADHLALTIRLEDKFGAHGLIAIVIGVVKDNALEIDTWLMSCRVLKRQVEEVTLNEIVRLARSRDCERVVGIFRPTAKNGLVAELFPTLGFRPISKTDSESVFELEVASYVDKPTAIDVARKADGTT